MEYYGKILCISKDDLTRDDRPIVTNGLADYSNCNWNGNIHPSMIEQEKLAPIMSEGCYKKMVQRNRRMVARKGIGRGVTALIIVDNLPEKYKRMVKEKYGSMETEALRNWFASHWEVDANARSWYSTYRLPSGDMLKLEQQQEYTLNASALQAVVRLLNDTKMKRAVMQGSRVRWEEMSGAISFYQKEFGHTLPTSVSRFKKKVKDFQEKGYASLISGKFGNQNTRKVNVSIERLVVSIASRMEKPWNTDVCKMYNQFVRHELEMFNPDTGEIYNPKDFCDKEGNPIELSPSTVQYYLTLPRNKVLIDKRHMSWADYYHEQMPHVHRHGGEFSLSQITMDDVDLPRRMKDGGYVHAYYAYDVVSQCRIGVAYGRAKDQALVVECFRDMFRTIDRNGWGMPAGVEVEQHLMSEYKDGFLQAGVAFPFVHFCAPQNSQEKYAEPLNGAFKTSIAHKNHEGIGRFYGKGKWRTERKKVSDAGNHTYMDKKYYTWEELVADDRRDTDEWNNAKHPNQKKYPGMSRWDVLVNYLNPNLKPLDKIILARHIGERVDTSIRRNSVVRVAYQDWWISAPEVLERLQPNNYKVTAHYLPDEEGTPTDVYLFQGDKYIDKVERVETFNRVMAEQTDDDKVKFMEQEKKIARHAKYINDRVATPVGIMNPETIGAITEAPAKEVVIPTAPDDDFMNYNVGDIRKTAIESM